MKLCCLACFEKDLEADTNYLRLGNSTQIRHTAANLVIFHTLRILVSGGLALGFLAGFVRTRYRMVLEYDV